jgi:CBS domain-containing protein
MVRLQQLLEGKGRTVHAVGPDAPVLEAIRLMAENHVGALLVMEGGRLAGIVSERDYARKVILMGRSSASTPVRDIMSTPVISIAPEGSVDEAMRTMTDHRIRHLPVLSGDTVVGIVSIGDLVKCVIEDQKSLIENLEHYIRS